VSKNTKLLVGLCFIALAMLGVAFSFVPLYRIFCQALSIPVPRVAVGEHGTMTRFKVSDRTVEVNFVADAARGVPIRFAPMDYSLRVRLGEPVLTAYTAFNTSPLAMDGVAVHMLYGMGGAEDGDVARYVDLRQCFCFESQHYPPGQEIRLPLSFVVTPDLPPGVHTITFAYTLFKALPDDPRIRPRPATNKAAAPLASAATGAITPPAR
jgi:cytochrome c oxidase assembly protein subunit 11